MQLTNLLKKYLSEFNPAIEKIEIIHGPILQGDIPHSLASVDKAKLLLGYNPSPNISDGFREYVRWN